jgi:pimeloyl-ACP methyl ester carboxylesterase
MANTTHPRSANGSPGRLVPIGDTRLYVVEAGQGYPLLLLHGGPGLDHTMFGDFLNPLTDQFHLILVDQRSQGRSEMSRPETWTLVQMARDVGALARALGLEQYAVLGHSFGAFVALQHAVDFPGQAAQTIVSSDPRDPRIEDYERRSSGSLFSPEVVRHFAVQDYGTIEVEGRLGEVTQPVLVLAGRSDRTCSVEAAEVMARGIPRAELVIFEHSGHMTYVEENERYLATVRTFLGQHSKKTDV